MERFTFKQKADYFYLKVNLEFDAGNEVSFDILTFKRLLLIALDSLHGQVGSSIPVDVLKFDPVPLEAVIRIPESGLVKVWSALTLYGSHQEVKCAFRVTQVSPHLIALAANSRQWKLDGLQQEVNLSS
ncbi:ribonuclease P protein subunit p14 [Nematostella vectensis]|uniref:ribonuclease P protein subunit p14 n=1 Tax=Nematostella vectensis TaxID=45351 RepID=UPI0020773534|nr:ribonuclease P protein subunit p14 [Nematostella vectensis]XP_048584219.1 ribonuclease P protein subunit p14 [Nematostella vectensis]XP_048584220.1 ribonuclease P protein subunit p14 [Nematostella vectensis]